MDKEISSRILKSIDDYVKGNLGPIEVDELWVQLLQNPEYYPLLKTEAGLKKHYSMKGHSNKLPLNYIPRFNSNRSWIITLAALLLITLFINLFRSSVETEIQPVYTNISYMHLISPDVTRSSAEHLSEFDQSLHRSFLLAVTGEPENAISNYHRLMEISDNPKNHAVLNYNLAISYFNIGDYESSVRHFQNLNCPYLNDFAYIESCFWLQTNSFLSLQNFERAHDSAAETLQMNGTYKDDAYNLLRKLQSIQ